ncbi:MAG: RrF2 family transcriptional regulator [Planctomycetota bacterium]|jgi:Rrf2 family protein
MLSSTAEYALRIMIVLAESAGEPLTSAQIATVTKVPGDYATKILQWLRRAGLVQSQRGRGGGFQLRCNPRRTTLLDVVSVIDPLERITECPLGREAHHDQLCPLHCRIDEMIGLLENSLRGMTIQSVLEGEQGPALCQPSGSKPAAKGAQPARSRPVPPAGQ